MVIFLNLDGSCENITPQRVFQGSNNVTDITVVAPFPSTTAMQIGFILPDGLYWVSSDNARYAPMEFVEQDTVNGVSVWHFDLPVSLTREQGDLYIAINAVTTDGNTTSFMCRQPVEESVLPNLPDTPEQSVYDLIQLYLARLDGRTANVANLVADIQKVAPNAFTFTNNSGVTSAPIVLEGGDTAPIPVNASSTIQIPKTAWQPVYSGQTVTGYTVLITAAQHGQMRDGATVHDLWVSFDETENNVISGAYQGYTVSASGDITVNVNHPIDMTLRVWNGKGLVDEVARDMVEQETARAETEEDHLQEQITELQNTGVDTEARAQIAAETARAEQAEQSLQTQITAETNRATAAENVLASDIEGLREDIINESHFKGMFTSVEALKAEYPTATPNDYAYIVGGNKWIYENGQWVDSRVSTPNTAVPKGTATPLMDGIGSAGVANAYAPEDHRHPENTNKVNKSGDTMTGPLQLPKILGTGETQDRGIIPVRWIDRKELGIDSSDGIDAYLQAWLKKVCELYPNTKSCLFIGLGNPASEAIIFADIYDTSVVNSDGMPRYVIGIARQYASNMQQFNVSNYVYSSDSILNNSSNIDIVKSSGNVSVGVGRTDTGSHIGLDIGSGGTNRGLYDRSADKNINKWIVMWDDTDLNLTPPSNDGNVNVNGVVPYSSKNVPEKQPVNSSVYPTKSNPNYTIAQGQTYAISTVFGNIDVPSTAIGGFIRYGTMVGAIVSQTSFLALTSGQINVTQTTLVSFYGYSIGG